MQDISLSEKQFIRQSFIHNIRSDGRGGFDFRPVTIENDIFPHCNGSSRVTINNSIDVLCSIKLSVSSNFNPIKYVDIATEISSSCTSKKDELEINEMTNKINEIIGSMLTNSCQEHFKRKLTIIEGKFYWTVNIDLLILQMNGNPIDVCSWAVYTALQSTYLPSVEIYKGESGEYEDFEINSDICQSNQLFSYPSPVPITITLSKISEDTSFLVDITSDESHCVISSLTIAISNDQKCHLIRKYSGNFLSIQDTTHAIQYVKDVVSSIYTQLHSHKQETDNDDRLYPDIPPMRLGLLA